ncbi:methionyl-tRNA formyltransferase [Penicillium taxi]|uniref:methionyl-tRNA formyltransferase n=1 Tax=Penicillium taxi TaxID=168475 RepID=UPI0025450608|nr:methionyl-tRNA formyltransferase [Penicillium taxi]KAJ5894336.1 methionyl-tRNA formyltransferase [Penicillium taxi]
MFVVRSSGAFALFRNACSVQRPACRFLATKSYDPLRILFCGSDSFSIASLKALHAYSLQNPNHIASIDVVCRPGKRVGRGLKEIREGESSIKYPNWSSVALTYSLPVPIKQVASDLSLPIHEINTFTGWTPPVTLNGPINLIIAVSFGLFVPPRLLKEATYGGLNVHPSILPDLRGPAPLHHTLLAGRTTTGVTLQTLHHEKFDNGAILAQTPAPGFDIPNPESCTLDDLGKLVAPKGANILIEGIKNGLFVPPVKEVGWNCTDSKTLIHAGKIMPEDRHIDWMDWTMADLNRHHRVLGNLWTKTLAEIKPGNGDGVESFSQKRMFITDFEEVDIPAGCESFALVPGLPFTNASHPVGPKKGRELYVFTRDCKLLRINQVKVEGDKLAEGLRAAIKAHLFGDHSIKLGDAVFTPFRNPLA